MAKNKTLQQLMDEQKAFSAAVGGRVNKHTDRKTQETKTFVAATGGRVNKHTDKKTQETKTFVAATGGRVNKHTTKEAEATRKRSDDNHAETRRHSDDNHAETRRWIAALEERVTPGQVIIGIILGIIAGISLWLAEHDVIVKPTAFDAVGNATAYGTDTYMVALLAIVLAVFVFFTVTWLIGVIRKALNR